MYYDLTIVQFTKMLKNMNGIFDKAIQHAEAKKFDPVVLCESRLAPDQFNFVRQVQILCDTAKRGSAFLAGKEPPVHEDKEKTLPELKARIESVVTFLGTFNANDFKDSATRKISQPRWEGQHMLGSEYLLQHVVPNFYFHLTTAYAILRHNGVNLGKADYLGPLPLKR